MLRRAVALKGEYDEAEQRIRSFRERVMMMGGVMVNREEASAAKTRRDQAMAGLRGIIEEVQETGCLIKDLDIGLLDFPTSFRGVEVYLCWRMGETAIEYWHGIDEGFRGRKPIDQDFL